METTLALAVFGSCIVSVEGCAYDSVINVIVARTNDFASVEGASSIIMAVIGDGFGYVTGIIIAAPRANCLTTLEVALVLMLGGVFGVINSLPAEPCVSFVCGALFGVGCGMFYVIRHVRSVSPI